MNSRIVAFTILIFILLITSCSNQPPATIPAPPTQPAATQTAEINPTLQGPQSIYLIKLEPETVHAHVLAMGEEDLQKQEYGTFVFKNHYYQHSIFAPSPSVLVYRLEQKYETFTTTLFMQPCESPDADGAFFVIELDGEVAYRSEMMNFKSNPVSVSLDVSGVSALRLEVYSTPNIGVDDPNGDCDASVWGDPLLVDEDPQPDQPAVNTFIPPQIQNPTTPGDPMISFYISPTGSDENPGTIEQPFATLEHTRDVIRTINLEMSGPIEVFLRGGTYLIDKTIQFDQRDSGSNGFDVIYQSYPNETPVISGGIELTGWKTVTGQPYWMMTVPDSIQLFRNLYVNDNRAKRAQTESVVAGVDFWKGDWSDRDGIVIDLDGPDWWFSNWDFYPPSQFIMSPSKLPHFSRPQDLELHWNHEWIDIRQPVDTILPLEDGKNAIVMTQPYFSWSQNLRYTGWDTWPEPGGHWYEPSWDRPFYIENALELMDTPGEWYFNPDTRDLFYYPRPGELPGSSKAVIPQVERLISIQGAGIGYEVHNLQFKGLRFEHSSWMRANTFGTASNFAQQLNDGESSLFSTLAEYFTPPAIRLEHVKDVQFSQDVFSHLGSVALGLANNVSAVEVVGNAFMDISDAAITMGEGSAHMALDRPGEVLVHDVLINNNLVHSVGTEYWGAHAIIGYYVHDVEVSHNFVQAVPNSGISLSASGFTGVSVNGIGNNLILFNHVDQSALKGTNNAPGTGGDAGAIHIGGNQLESLIEGNYVSNVVNHYTCIYLDLANNDNLTIQKNVCQNAPMWLSGIGARNLLAQQNYTDTNVALDFYFPTYITADNPYHDDNNNNHIIDTFYDPDENWPPEALAIMNASGLEDQYQYLLNLIPE